MGNSNDDVGRDLLGNMEIFFSNRKLQAALEDPAMCKKRYGVDMAKKLVLRLTALKAAESLATFWPPMSGPERCHELKGELAGTFSIDLKQPYRLLFIPIDLPTQPPPPWDPPTLWQLCRAIEITGIADTHG
jgi:plasmid maintenance system killer protein